MYRMSGLLFVRNADACRLLVVIVVVVGAGLAGPAGAQVSGVVVGIPGQAGPGLPLRDRPEPAPTGTAEIRGRVMGSDGLPLRRVQVRVSGAGVPVRRVTSTDGEGRFSVRDLPAGSFTVSASKVGYVALAYGQRTPGRPGPGTPIALADGETKSVDLTLPKAGVIAGRLTDEFGDPLPQTQIMVQRYQYLPNGQRSLVTAGMASMTDDLGQFRAYGLQPGEYVVMARPNNQNVVIAPGMVADPMDGFPPSFYPGTINAADAQILTVGAGQEIDVQFQIASMRLGRVTGSVTRSDGRPAWPSMVMLVSGTSNSFTTAGMGIVGPDGTFTLSSVPPGDHVLQVRPQQPNAEAEFASVPVSVASGDSVSLRIVTSRGAIVSGRVIYEGSSPRTGPGPQRVTVQSTMPGPSLGGQVVADADGTIQADGTFRVAAGTGRVLLRPQVPPGWVLKSITLDTEDITDTGIDVTGRQQVSDVRIVLTDRLTELTGLVTDANGTPAVGATTMIVPADDLDGRDPQRFVRTVPTGPLGRFQVRGLPPGRYVVLAIPSLGEPGQMYSPDVQARVRQAGKTVSLTEGERVTLDLRVVADF